MALAHVLTLSAALLLPEDRCDFVVDGAVETSPVLELASLYLAGRTEEAIHGLDRLPPAAVEEAIERLEEKETLGPDDACLQAASLLESELGMMLVLRSRWEKAEAHFDSAWDLSWLIGNFDLLRRYQRDWLLAVGLFHQQLVFVNEPAEAFWRADRFLSEAVERYPRDPEILLAAGALLEWSGSLRYGSASHLKEAQELYARALEIAPDDPEALLRHGIVLRKLGRRDEAARRLLRVLEVGGDESLAYRSRMALGGLEEEAGRTDRAMEHYRAARGLVPSWQVALTAIAHLHHATGEHDRARALLEEALVMPDTEEALLGWWSYELGLSPRFQPLLDRMRGQVRK